MIRTSESGLALIREFEGFSSTPYICAGGYATIGYGHVLLGNEKRYLSEIDLNVAERLLAKDLQVAEQVIDKHVNIKISQAQFDALVSFIYNVGAVAFARSTLLKLLNRHAIIDAADEFDRWVYAKGEKLPGLIRRRAAEKNLFLQKPLNDG